MREMFAGGGREIMFELRGVLIRPERGAPIKGGNTVGNLFLVSDGWMWFGGGGFQVYKGESNEKVREEKGSGRDSTVTHMKNSLEACRSRNHRQLN